MSALASFPALTSPVSLAEALEPRWGELAGGGWSPGGPGASELGLFHPPSGLPSPTHLGAENSDPVRQKGAETGHRNQFSPCPQEIQLTGGSFLRADKPYCSDSPKPFRGAERQRETGPRPRGGNSPLALRPPYGLII